MKTSSAALTKALQEASALYAQPRVIIDWNQNRYAGIATVDNFGYPEADHGYDLDLYPINTIVAPVRPTAGIIKARAGEGVVTTGYDDSPATARYYTASPDSKYKYWTSPEQSTTTTYAGGGFTINNVSPYVIYKKPVWTNKIYLCFESSWSYPKSYDVMITTNGTTWSTIASNIAPGVDGTVTLYRQQNTSWNTNVYRDNPVKIMGLRVTVNSMSRDSSFFNLIEMGAHLESDVTAFVTGYSVGMNMAEADQISPIGIMSSNDGSVSLSNTDRRFTNDSQYLFGVTDNLGRPVENIYYGLIDENAKVTVDVGVDTSKFGGVGYEYVRSLTMYAEDWSSGDEVEITLKDSSKFLQEVYPLPFLMQNVTIGQAVWRILDSVGFNRYNYNRAADTATSNIPYFWTNPDATVWDNIQQIARTTQSVCYFDEYDVFNIVTRDSAFDRTKNPGWTLDYAKNGTKQPDIIDLAVTGKYEANTVTVTYTPTDLATDDAGNPISEIVWQPDGDVALRASNLSRDFISGATKFYIKSEDAASWPYEGLVNIGGEFVKYKGKEYGYVADGQFAFTYTQINSEDERRHLDRDMSNQFYSYRNYFTGGFYVVERGVDLSTEKDHRVNLNNFRGYAKYNTMNQTVRSWDGGITHFPGDSTMRLMSNNGFGHESFYIAPYGQMAFGDEAPAKVGTRLKFPSSPTGTDKAAGVFWYCGTDYYTGYYAELLTSDYVDNNNLRNVFNEMRVYRRNSTGTTTRLGSAAIVVADDNWYDIDVTINGPTFSISVNGRNLFDVTDSNQPASGVAGVFVRGYTAADFEYFYALDTGAYQDSDLDNTSYLDLINGGYYSNEFYRDALYQTRVAHQRRGRKTTTYKQKYNGRYFDEFGCVVHEVRDYDVKFDKKPVLHSSLYFSNTTQSICDEYLHDPFGARFRVANAYRETAIMNGKDTLTYPGNSVSQKMIVIGRTVQQKEAKNIEVSDADAIAARGPIELKIESQWIQTESAAKALADWIVTNWSTPADQASVQVFGNPLFQVGDVVAVNYPPLNYSAATHEFFVLEVKESWDNGITTQLTLRRAI